MARRNEALPIPVLMRQAEASCTGPFLNPDVGSNNLCTGEQEFQFYGYSACHFLYSIKAARSLDLTWLDILSATPPRCHALGFGSLRRALCVDIHRPYHPNDPFASVVDPHHRHCSGRRDARMGRPIVVLARKAMDPVPRRRMDLASDCLSVSRARARSRWT